MEEGQKASDLGEDRREPQDLERRRPRRSRKEALEQEEELGDGPHGHGGQDPPSWEKELENCGTEARRSEAAALDPDERSSEQCDFRSRKLGTNDNDDGKERVEYLLSTYGRGGRRGGSGAGAVSSSAPVWKVVGVEVRCGRFGVDKFTEETCSRVGGRFPLFGSYAY